MSHTRLILGFLLKEHSLEYSLKVFKKISKIFIIFFILLCQGLSKRFQNICKISKVLNSIYKSF